MSEEGLSKGVFGFIAGGVAGFLIGGIVGWLIVEPSEDSFMIVNFAGAGKFFIVVATTTLIGGVIGLFAAKRNR